MVDLIHSRLALRNADHIWEALHEQVPNVLSHCHTKRMTGARGRVHPSFGMTLTFQKEKKKESK